jgi:hypothetical protein
MNCDRDGGSAGACPPGYACANGICAVPGAPVSDIGSRYDSTTPEPTKPATPVGPTQRLCGAPLVLSGELTATDPAVNRSLKTSGGCIGSPYADVQDVYAIELVGSGPHSLELDSCGHSAIRMEVMLFQKPGSTTPYDTANSCQNMITSWEPSPRNNCNGGIQARSINMQPGIVYVVVTNEGGELGTYELTVKSDTSRCN